MYHLEIRNTGSNDIKLKKNIVFFVCVCQLIFKDFGMGVERVLGGFWRLSGVSWAICSLIFRYLYFEFSSKGALEASGIDFGVLLRSILEAKTFNK